jgi:hypothetical protein
MSKTNGKLGDSNGLERLPKASDFKLPKKLTKLEKERIETSRAVNESLHKAYLNEQKSKR